MKVKKVVESTSRFINEVQQELTSGTLATGDELDVTISSKMNILDLYALGRIISFLTFLTNHVQLKVHLNVSSVSMSRKSKLSEIGILKVCKENGIFCNLPPMQLKLLPVQIGFSRRVYWYCLLPLTKFKFDHSLDEAAAIAVTHRILNELVDNIYSSLVNLGISYKQLAYELNKIIYVIFKELILNSIMHSSSDSLYVALTISRENSAIGKRVKRPGFMPSLSIMDRYDLLVMDSGEGLINSVTKILSPEKPILDATYNSMDPWKTNWYRQLQKEETLMKSIFAGNLVIRKGRRSEGLYDVAKRISTFDGLLTFRGGRSEVQVHSETDITLRNSPNSLYYLPGVIASAILVSHQLFQLSTAAQIKLKETDIDRELSIERCPLPEGLIGGESQLEVRRLTELYARELFENFVDICKEKSPVFAIDLSVASPAKFDFVDSLIQEICKLQALEAYHGNQLLSHLILVNASRDLINNLVRSNANSFLISLDKFLLLLDAGNNPHFLGLPRITETRVLDFYDFITAIFIAKEVHEDVLWERWEVHDEIQQELIKSYFSYDTTAIFYLTRTTRNKVKFHCKDIINGLNESDVKLLSFTALNQLTAVKTKEVNIFNPSIASDTYYSETATVSACARILFQKISVPIPPTIVTFMANGEALASAIQRISGSPRLIILDTSLAFFLDNINLDSNIAIVVSCLDSDTANHIESLLDFAESTQYKGSFVLDILNDIDDDDKFSSNGNVPEYHLYRSPLIKEDPIPEQPYDKDNAITKPFNYSKIEFSSEFWHNACSLGIISVIAQGREKREVVFYENNEKLIENTRTRGYLEEYVQNFMINDMKLRVDVILHPSHSVGCYLAQLASNYLNKHPLVIRLNQSEYGGKIELLSTDYNVISNSIQNYQRQHKRSYLRALIVDDSVYSGSSIFTMLGIADILNIRVKGVMVLLNRLTPEVSASLASLPFKFTYLYRLHMPLLSAALSANSRLIGSIQNSTVGEESFFYSYFAGKKNLFGSELGDGLDEVDNQKPLRAPKRPLSITSSAPKSTYELRQILEGLILHHDPLIVNLPTRLAITYNFFGILLYEDSFWDFLFLISEYGISESKQTNENFYLRKVLSLIIQTNYPDERYINEKLKWLCYPLLRIYFSTTSWELNYKLINYCILTLLLVDQTEAVRQLRPTVEILIESAINTDLNSQSSDVDAIIPAWFLLGTYSWGIAGISRNKKMLNSKDLLNKVTILFKTSCENFSSNDIEREFALLDIYKGLIHKSTRLQNMIGIQVWKDQIEYIAELNKTSSDSNPSGYSIDNPMFRYLVEAPGYTFTLKSLLMVSKATTALLFAKNSSDNRYFLRDYTTESEKRPEEELSLLNLNEEFSSRRIRHRMKNNMFYFSANKDELLDINAFSSGTTHTWMIGMSVIPKEGTEQYYIVLGYTENLVDIEDVRSVIYYTQKFADLLQVILPKIHEKHIVSSTAWNAIVQAIRPIHPGNRFDNERRMILGFAIGLIDLGELVSSAVTATTQRAILPHSLLESIEDLMSSFRSKIRKAAEILSKTTIIPTDDAWPIKIITQKHELAYNYYISFHSSMLDFILYECLCNALSNYISYIDIYLEVDAQRTQKDNKVDVILTITNDYLYSVPPQETSGRPACKKAANALGGDFSSEGDGQIWAAKLILPAYRVPNDFRGWLHAYI